MARNLLIIQSKPAGLSLAPSRHRNASYRRRYVTNRRNINANGVLFSAAVGSSSVLRVGSALRSARQSTWRHPERSAHQQSRWTHPCFSQSSLITKEWVPHVPTLGHGIARTRAQSPVLHFCSALLFCTFFDAFRCASTIDSRPRSIRLHPRQPAHFSLPQNFCVSLCHPYVIRASPVYSEDVPLIGRGRIHRRVCPIIPNS